MAERLFREKHPIVVGFLVLAGIFLLFWGGITFLLSGLGRSSQSELFVKKNSIGIVELRGPIVTAEKAIAELTDFRRNEAIRAVIVRIDSPGGAVGASQEIFAEIKRTNEVKPVVASLGSVAASGGYYAALGAERIVASPGTLTGSLGVILKFANLEELFSKIGYRSEVIKSGAMKDIGSMSRPLTDEERRLLQDLTDTVHEQFIRAVSEERGLTDEQVRKLADGRIFSGEQAKEYGLLDELGNFTDAVLTAARLAGLETDTPPLVYPEEEDFSLFKLLAGGNADALLSDMTDRIYPILAYQWTVGGR